MLMGEEKTDEFQNGEIINSLAPGGLIVLEYPCTTICYLPINRSRKRHMA